MHASGTFSRDVALWWAYLHFTFRGKTQEQKTVLTVSGPKVWGRPFFPVPLRTYDVTDHRKKILNFDVKLFVNFIVIKEFF
jgi:hypothetical protein